MKSKQNLLWHLRVTVLPQCNLFCRYCNPKGVYEKSATLEDDEIIELVQAAVENGIVRIHWTGGEPCIRDMKSLISRAKSAGMIEQTMTTNGTLRLSEVSKMRSSGLSRVNISLDTLDPKKFEVITGSDKFENVVQWIKTSCDEFNFITKMNIVPMNDNIDEIPAFIKFAQQFNGKLQLKFIELCPNNPAFYDRDIYKYTVNRREIIERLEKIGSLTKILGIGDNPNAEYYLVGDTGVTIILITMPSQDFKCGLSRCRKMRVSPFGLVGSCIQQKGVNIKGLTLSQKIEVIKNKMLLRESYSDDLPTDRSHYRNNYGIWRFGKIK